jgi:hypothetical protein
LLIGVVLLAVLGLLAFAASNLQDGTGEQAGQGNQRQNQGGGAVPIAPESQTEATEPSQTEPQQTEPPPTEPEPTEPQEPAAPTSLAELIALLDANEGAYGEKQPDLADKVNDLLGRPEDERPEEAVKLQEETAEWVADGELDPEIGALAVQLLEPLAAQRPRQDTDEDDEDNPAEARAKPPKGGKPPGPPGRDD